MTFADANSSAREQRVARVLLIVLLFSALAIRIWNWPSSYESRDCDEGTYMAGSLHLLEGTIPPYSYTPAGPQTWLGWMFEGALAAKHFFFSPEEREVPFQVRAFSAIEHALFNAYRDGSVLRLVWAAAGTFAAIAAVAAGFRLGLSKAGIAGACLVGGTVAFTPIFVELSVEARPYMTAWAFGIIAIYYAVASPRPTAFTISAIAMGLAIASRIDMLLLLPLIWSESLRGRSWQERWRLIIRYHGTTLLVFLVVAPWFLMTLIGCLRIIATVRVLTAGEIPATPFETAIDVFWNQGLLVQGTLFIASVGLLVFGPRPRRAWLALYVLLLACSTFKSTAYGLRHQGPAIIVIAICGLFALSTIQRRWPRFAFSIALLSLLLPLAQSVRLVISHRDLPPQELAAKWIEDNVPAGTIVYCRPTLYNLLPTATSADASWAEVNDISAWRRKFKSGLKRFEVQVGSGIPRACSDENMIVERGNRRGLYILGAPRSRSPRFDVRYYQLGPVFGVQDVLAAFKQSGGVLVVEGDAANGLLASLGPSTVKWVNRNGTGTRVFCSPDVVARMESAGRSER